MVPRPFGPVVHGTSTNDLLQFNYIELFASSSVERYVLMLRDDHIGYSRFYPSITTSANVAVNALLD